MRDDQRECLPLTHTLSCKSIFLPSDAPSQVVSVEVRLCFFSGYLTRFFMFVMFFLFLFPVRGRIDYNR